MDDKCIVASVGDVGKPRLRNRRTAADSVRGASD